MTCPSVGRKCACTLGRRALTILSPGSGRLVNGYLWVPESKSLRRTDSDIRTEPQDCVPFPYGGTVAVGRL